MASPALTWEIAQALGFGAVAGCLILCVLAVRPRAGSTGAFRLRSHELLGWLVLAAAVLHVGLLLGADPVVIEHVKPTAPRYEYAGILALLILLFLSVAARAPLRSILWPSHRTFQAAHVGAAAVLVVALAMHVLTTARYVNGRAHAIAYALLSGVALLALLRFRAQLKAARQSPRVSGRFVFGRYSQRVVFIVLSALIALIPMMHTSTTLALREPFFDRNDRLVLDFPHDKHRAVNCVTCHHDYLDRSGQGSCISCHRSGRADIRVGAEARFHDFCLGCHRNPPANLAAHGPVTGCNSCHAPAGQTIGLRIKRPYAMNAVQTPSTPLRIMGVFSWYLT